VLVATYVKRNVDQNMDWWIGCAVGASDLFIHDVVLTPKRYYSFFDDEVFLFQTVNIF
jgi:hypothetical protein